MRRAARLLLYLGTAATVVGLSKVHAAWVADPPYDYTGSSRLAWSVVYGSLLALAAYGIGLPDVPRSTRSAAGSALASTAAGAASVSLLQLVAGSLLLPRFVVFGAVAVLVPWYVLCSLLATGAHERAEDRDRVVFVGRPEEAAELAADLGLRPERPAHIAASLTVSGAASTEHHRRPLVEEVVTHAASVVVLDRSAQADESIVTQAAALHESGVRVRTLSLFYEQWLGKLPLNELERVSLMFDIGELHRIRYGRVKRLADVAIGVVGLVPLVVLGPFVVIGNLIGNRGPLLYRQARVGRGGRHFQILKFRTMRPSSGGLANEWTTEDDPRITPFGGVLRRTHLDELPQVVNIVRGELSMVGPRPEQPHYVAELSQKIPFYDLRHLVRPGLTGWAQVKYGYAGNERDALEKLQYEFFYLRHQGLGFDARIIGRTIRSVIGLRGQ